MLRPYQAPRISRKTRMLASLRDDVYQVRLSVFEGPLDLLLQLIEREKLDISSVSLAQVTDQFLTYVRELEDIQAETLADFLVVAVRLVWIKSRLLLPQAPKAAEEEEEDPAEALARQLREYKRFKEAAQELRAIEEQGRHTYVRAAAPPEMERRLQADASAMDELLAAARVAFASAPSGPPAEMPGGLVTPFTLTIHDQIEHIRQATADGRAVTFRALLGQARYRFEIVVTLLAVLELIKRLRIQVRQDQMFGEIVIAPVAGVEITDDEEDAQELETAA